ncbi:organic cation transporter protein-like isoform X2 [Littorina saxatilis]|uniref:Major facilitator superfamily (MFS) profile domain-containing protein n=2 Tax=Littorina saxatilis TaxID=31220 RepID=A0AAN9BNJ5_9CAEN
MKFDEVLTEIGEFGPYQKRVYFLATAPAILLAFETLSVVFIFNIPKHRCALPGDWPDTYNPVNDSHNAFLNRSIPLTNGEWDQCHVFNDVSSGNFSFMGNATRSRCSKWVYDHSTFTSTIATDFDVVCERSVYRAGSNMISESGTIVGTFLCGFLADRYGRKVTFYVSGLALMGGGFGIAFTTNFINLNICRFFLGIARMATWINSFVIGMEIVGPSKRTFAGMAIEYIWVAGELLLLLCAYFIRNWRYLEIAVSVPSVGLLFYWWLIPESPRWLASRGREEEALKILQRIADSNQTKLPAVGDTKRLLEADDQGLGFRHVLRSRELVVRTIIVFSNMFVTVMVYYGLTLNITNLSGDIYQNFALNVVLELVAYVSPFLLLDRVGRKPVYCGSMLLAGTSCVFCIVPVLAGSPGWVVSLLSTMGRFFVSIAFAVIYLYGTELFPTMIRTSTMGVGITFARVGNIVSPYLADVGILVGGKFKDALPLLVMGTPAVLVGILSLWLPETLGRELPETMEDVNNTPRKRRWSCWSTQVHNERSVHEKDKISINTDAV